MTTTIKVRGCGTRVAGGIYLCCGTSPDGKPVEHFLIDPPAPIDAQALGLSAVGVTIVEHDGDTHVLDQVGEKHYPNVCDFIEEVRHMGVSRRVPKTIDFSLLTRGSRMLLAHPKAFIDNHEDFRGIAEDPELCPKAIEEHAWAGMCIGLCYRDVEGLEDSAGDHSRVMPWGSYAAEKLAVGEHRLALFASFPITSIEVIYSPDGEHEVALEKARAAGVPVLVMDQ